MINVNPLALCSMMMDVREYGELFWGMDGWMDLPYPYYIQRRSYQNTEPTLQFSIRSQKAERSLEIDVTASI
jgi:hypothetical protein